MTPVNPPADPSANRLLLWWGRFDPAYSRNGVIRHLLQEMGWKIRDFHPHLSGWADWEAAFARLPRPAAVWVPCFRQRDVLAAARWARRHGVPLIFDPLISAYDKQVSEHRKFPADDPRAVRLLAKEREQFVRADRVVADTVCHAAYFHETLRVPEERLRVVYVGAESCFVPPAAESARPDDAPVEVLFYGGFIELHGVETIVEAARRYQGPPVRWCLLGDGPMRTACQRAAEGLAQVTFEPPVPYADLCGRIHRADILLGVFGTTPKAGRVMPNKVFQALAAGRPVITRASEAYPEPARDSEALAFIPPGDPRTLADGVARWAADRQRLAGRGHEARALYERCFASPVIVSQLSALLDGLPG